ncbi:putative 1-phosphatidylinositol-3-phosphate 5-kinase FAB1C [Tanacetum coccineum]
MKQKRCRSPNVRLSLGFCASVDKKMVKRNNAGVVYALVQWAKGSKEDATGELLEELYAKFPEHSLVSDNSLLDLIEKVGSWIYWGTSDMSTLTSSEVKMGVDDVKTVCCECKISISESCLGYNCGRCSRLFCERCVQGYSSFVVVESKSGTQAGLDIRTCKFCVSFDVRQKFGGKFSHKIHPSDSHLFNHRHLLKLYLFAAQLAGTAIGPFLFVMLKIPSDEDEGEDSSKNIISPYSLDTSDVGSSSANTRHEFCSFMSVTSSPSDSPSGIHYTSSRLAHSVHRDDQGTPRDQYEPLDLENNGLIWLPLTPDDEDTDFFSYADDDEMGPAGDGHFRALVSQLLQSEFMPADEWVDIITSLAWQAANFVKPDTNV